MNSDSNADLLLRQMWNTESLYGFEQVERHLSDFFCMLVTVSLRQPRNAQIAITDCLHLEKWKIKFSKYFDKIRQCRRTL